MNRRGTIVIASVMMVLFSGSSASATDKDIAQLQLDVAKLQRTIQELQTSVDAKNAAMSLQMGKMADQVNNLTDSMRKVTDLISTIKSDNAATAAAAAKSANETRDTLLPLMGELRKSIDDLTAGQTAMRSQEKFLADQIIAMKSTSEPLATCKDDKQNADRSFNSNYLDDAIAGYREFLSNPTCASDPKAAEVQFQIAESFFLLKKFDQAIPEYDTFLQKYPANDKTASALLRKGLAHTEQKQTTEARAAFTRVTTEFKGTPEAVAAAAKLKELGSAAGARGARGTQ
jgi:TolA-binding protein